MHIPKTAVWLAAAICAPALHAQSAIPPAQFWYPYDENVSFDPDLPGMGAQVQPRFLGSDTIRWSGRIEGYALGDGLPEVLARFNLTSPPESGGSVTINGASTIQFYFRVVPMGTDPFGELALVPLQMDYFASLGAFPQLDAKVFSFASIRLTDLAFGSSFLLREFRACASTALTGLDSCFGQFPPRPTLYDEGTIAFNVLGSVTHELHIAAQFQLRCIAAACSAHGSSLLDPMPRLDLDADPQDYGRPAGFRLQDHYRLEFSANHVTGPRQALLRNGFED